MDILRGDSQQIKDSSYVKGPRIAWEIRWEIRNWSARIHIPQEEYIRKLSYYMNYKHVSMKHPKRTHYTKNSTQALDQRLKSDLQKFRKRMHGR